MDKTVFLYLDGFKYSYLAKTRFLKKLSEKSVYGNTKIIPMHQFEFTIFSGKLPEEHGLWVWYCFDPEKSPYKWTKYFLWLFRPAEKIPGMKGLLRFFISGFSSLKMLLKGETRLVKIALIPLEKACLFGISAKKAYIDKKPIESKMLFDYLAENNVKYIASEFPFVSTNGKMELKPLVSTDKKKLDYLLKNGGGKDFIFVHLWKLDSVMHKYGSESSEALAYLQELDGMIESFLKKLGEKHNVRVIACSDHGMSGINGYLNMDGVIKQTGLEEGVDYEKFYDSMMARFWCKNNKALEKIKKKLQGIAEGRTFTPSDAEKLFVSNERKIFGDLLFVANEGIQLLPNYFDGFGKTRAQHGFIPESNELDGMFMLYEEGMENRMAKDISILDILPSSLDFMGIRYEKGLKGKSVLKK